MCFDSDNDDEPGRITNLMPNVGHTYSLHATPEHALERQEIEDEELASLSSDSSNEGMVIRVAPEGAKISHRQHTYSKNSSPNPASPYHTYTRRSKTPLSHGMRRNAGSCSHADSPAMPITPFIGVRISWLIMARNSVRARVAASAASRAAASACSVCLRSVISV